MNGFKIDAYSPEEISGIGLSTKEINSICCIRGVLCKHA